MLGCCVVSSSQFQKQQSLLKDQDRQDLHPSEPQQISCAIECAQDKVSFSLSVCTVPFMLPAVFETIAFSFLLFLDTVSHMVVGACATVAFGVASRYGADEYKAYGILSLAAGIIVNTVRAAAAACARSPYPDVKNRMAECFGHAVVYRLRAPEYGGLLATLGQASLGILGIIRLCSPFVVWAYSDSVLYVILCCVTIPGLLLSQFAMCTCANRQEQALPRVRRIRGRLVCAEVVLFLLHVATVVFVLYSRHCCLMIMLLVSVCSHRLIMWWLTNWKEAWLWLREHADV